ncbi:pilus assembly FimT family protein [Scleromatobacter humisilvae]|uniref:Prepilin-type N-terminal cleavage/methylation domain-containing protein n=1 Tax=Scleromatobacter humisilvae TaxID=2897159 RepID=A0A9X2C427_9BURK|nr:prepilin-type N-terminal cleavage/methylation domain-containing protein [Scleromatobacter humisilvae]MCK9688505.1 prepilin-type N-terminal cleavage/methylation domain-containing protein [Scleromatobacter humisilvae]
MSSRTGQRGFSVIELMVTLTIAALLVTLAAPYFGKASAQANERRVKQQLVQDITWARGAAGAADQKSLDASLASGTPTVTLTINADCSWTTKVSGNVNAAHTMATTPTAMSCAPAATAGVPTLPTTFTFTPQGFLSSTASSGTLVLTGTTTSYRLQILYSGSVIETHATTGVDS